MSERADTPRPIAREMKLAVFVAVVSAILSAVASRAAGDLSWPAMLGVGAAVAAVVGVWALVIVARRILARLAVLEQAVEAEAKRIESVAAALGVLSRTTDARIAGLRDRVDLATVAAVPGWLPSTVDFAKRAGWVVNVFGTSVHFTHAEHDPVNLDFPLGDDPDACRDALYKHLGHEPHRFLAKMFSVKRIGGERRRPQLPRP